MARTKSSQRWLHEHFRDPYVKRAQQEGYRSRAAYKLQELNRRDRLLKPGMTIVDLGAAPGGWSQVARQLVGKHGRIIAVDILAMAPLAGVEFIQGDFREDATLEQLLTLIGGVPIDIVISDMAPNLSGITAVDQPRVMYLAELVADTAEKILKPEGCLLLKLFQGAGFDAFLLSLRKAYAQVVVRKPDASRAQSAEVYVLAKGYKANQDKNSIIKQPNLEG